MSNWTGAKPGTVLSMLFELFHFILPSALRAHCDRENLHFMAGKKTKNKTKLSIRKIG